MSLPPFKLERFFAKYEFKAPYLLCASDIDALDRKELMALADDESMELWENLKLDYTQSQGHPILRSEISRLYRSITSDEIVTLVPEEGIFLSMNVLLEKGDHVVCTYPGYQSLYEIGQAMGCQVDKWMPHFHHNQGWKFHLEDLTSLIRPETKLLVINFPHNPTGATLSSYELEYIIKLAKENGTWIFSDEMYRLMEYDPEAKTDSVCDQYERGISLFGMSKSFALPGIRIGWLAMKDKAFLENIISFKDYTTICSSAPSEIMALIGLRAKIEVLERNKGITMKNLSILDEFMKEFSHIFDWKAPLAGPISFPQVKIEEEIDLFCQRLVDEKGVLLLPSTVYEIPGKFVRLSFARKNMAEALEQLAIFLRYYY